MAADVLLSVRFDNFLSGYAKSFTESEKQEAVKEIRSRVPSIDTNDFYEALKIMHKEGVIEHGNLDVLSCIMDKTTTSSKKEGVKALLKNYEGSIPAKDDVFVGRDDDVKKISTTLRNRRNIVPGMNLFGESGVGKTTLAKQVCKELKEFETMSVDLRDTKDMKTVYYEVLSIFGLKSWDYNVARIHMHLKNLTTKFILVLDNVEQLLSHDDPNTREEFIGVLHGFIGSAACMGGFLKLFLTSRDEISEVSLQRKLFTEFKVKPFRGVKEVVDVSNDALQQIIELCCNIPFMLQGAEQMMREGYRTPEQVLEKINTELENGVPQEFACISALFHTLLTDHLKEVAVKISLFRRPFSVSAAMRIADISSKFDAKIDLEMLVKHKIIHVSSEDMEKKRKYDIHNLFQKFVKVHLCTSDVPMYMYSKEYENGEKQFFKHFSGKMTKLASSLENEFVETYSKLEANRANFEVTIEISLKTEDTFALLLHSDEFNKAALMGILFETLKERYERRDLYSRWAEEAEKQEQWLASAHLRCWQSIQISDMEGTRVAREILAKASESLEKARSKSTRLQFAVVESLFHQCRGKINWMTATYLTSKERRKLIKNAVGDLQNALEMRVGSSMEGDHTLNARALNLLGNCYMELMEFEPAGKYYQHALDMKVRLVGSENHWEIPTYYNQLAQVNDMLARKEEKFFAVLFGSKKAKEHKRIALEWMEKSLKLQEDLGVSDTENTATFQRNMANILIGHKQYDKALKFATKCYDNRAERLGQHPETVRILYLMGIIHEWRKDRNAALGSYEKAFEMEEALSMDNHSVVRKLIRDRLLEMCKKEKKKEKAEQYKAKIREIEQLEKLLLENPPEEPKPEPDPSTQTELHPPTATDLEEQEIELGEEPEEEPGEGLEVAAQSCSYTGPTSPARFSQQHALAELKFPGNVRAISITVNKQGGTYYHDMNGLFLHIPPHTVTQRTTVTCEIHPKHSLPSPCKHRESLVSYLSGLGPSSVELRNSILATLVHCGPGMEHGYETVVKALNKETNEWDQIKEVDEPEYIPEDYKTPKTVIQVRITRLTVLAVVARLVTDEFKVTPSGCVVTSSVCENVTVTFPKGAVDRTHQGSMQLMPVPKLPKDTQSIPFPILFFNGFKNVSFLKPVIITIRHSLAAASGEVLLLRLDNSEQSEKQWKDITHDIRCIKDQLNIELYVKQFCGLWTWSTFVSKVIEETATSLYKAIGYCPRTVSFAAYSKHKDRFDLQLTCTAKNRQKALTTYMEGKGFDEIKSSTGDQPMWRGGKAYPDVENESDWDRHFFLELLEDEDCDKEFEVETTSEKITLRFFPDGLDLTKQKDEKQRLGKLTLKKLIEERQSPTKESSEYVEYYGITFKALREVPQDIVSHMLKHFEDQDQAMVAVKHWATRGAKWFFSTFPRKTECLDNLVNALETHFKDATEHTVKWLKNGSKVVHSPLRQDNKLKSKVTEIVANNLLDVKKMSTLACQLGLSNETINHCKQYKAIDEQVRQILSRWIEDSDSSCCKLLFEKLRICGCSETVGIKLAEYITNCAKSTNIEWK